MSVAPITVGGVKPYSDMPVIVGPVQSGFSAALGGAVTSSSAAQATAASTTSGRSAPLARSSATASTASGFSTAANGALTTSTGRSVLTLGQMVVSGSTSGAVSPLGAATITRPGTATLGAVSGLSKSGASAPEALQAYGNGRIPLEMLTPIGIGSHRLYAPAAQGFMAMRAAAAAEGVDIGITDSYRTYDQQVELAARKGLYSQGGYAAVPGTSKHGWGVAVDIDVDASGLAWMRANADRFGFVENVPREPWHWEFTGT